MIEAALILFGPACTALVLVLAGPIMLEICHAYLYFWDGGWVFLLVSLASDYYLESLVLIANWLKTLISTNHAHLVGNDVLPRQNIPSILIYQ